jgi:hypothetical protein
VLGRTVRVDVEETEEVEVEVEGAGEGGERACDAVLAGVGVAVRVEVGVVDREAKVRSCNSFKDKRRDYRTESNQHNVLLQARLTCLSEFRIQFPLITQELLGIFPFL